MYDLLDRPVRDLPDFERSVLRSIRGWVHALTLAGAEPAQGYDDHFCTAMRALDRGSADELAIERPCHATVGDTEAVILGLWRLVRADRLGPARAAAARLVDPASAVAMVSAMSRAAAAHG